MAIRAPDGANKTVFTITVPIQSTVYFGISNCGVDFLVVMRQWHMFQRGAYGGGPIFKVVLEYKERCYEPFLIYIFGILFDFMQKSC